MFPRRAQNILQRYDLYGSLTFLTFVSQKSPEYILFFCKMWIITYVGKVKNSSLIIWILFVTLFAPHLYSCLEFFKRLGSCKVTYIGKSRISTEGILLSSKYSIRKKKNVITFIRMIKDYLQLSHGNRSSFALV